MSRRGWYGWVDSGWASIWLAAAVMEDYHLTCAYVYHDERRKQMGGYTGWFTSAGLWRLLEYTNITNINGDMALFVMLLEVLFFFKKKKNSQPADPTGRTHPSLKIDFAREPQIVTWPDSPVDSSLQQLEYVVKPPVIALFQVDLSLTLSGPTSPIRARWRSRRRSETRCGHWH